MNKKRKRLKPRFYIISVMILAGITFMIVDNMDINIFAEEERQAPKTGDYVLFDSIKAFIVFEDKFVIDIPSDVNIEREKPFSEYLRRNEYKLALQNLNKILPENINNYIVGNEENIPQGLKIIPLPIVELNEALYPDTFELTELFVNEYYEIDTRKNKEILIDILNANGISGDAGSAGQALEDKFGYRYKALNHETHTNYTYIVNNSLSRKRIEEIVLTLRQKNIKIQETPTVSTIADAVIILGQENVHLEIVLKGTTQVPVNESNRLNDLGYKNIRRFKTDEKVSGNIIYYDEEDYFSAFKISKYLGITRMQPKSGLNNSIEVIIEN